MLRRSAELLACGWSTVLSLSRVGTPLGVRFGKVVAQGVSMAL